MARLCVLVLLAGMLSACAQLPDRPQLADEIALAIADTAALDTALHGIESNHPNQSAFRLVTEGIDAFAIRAHSARLATRSLDVQTYIWHADLTGLYLAYELLMAADRGVKVRLLLDDMDARAKNDGLAALAAHPNISVRLFNPFGSRSGTARLIGEGMRNFGRLNRRMHNKSWIADNRVAVAGGRNVGDEYFSASDGVNFIDLDFAMIGPVVRDASASFDRYWNAPTTYPIDVLDPKKVNDSALVELRKRLDVTVAQAQTSKYAATLREHDSVQRMVSGAWPLMWSSDYRFVADDPLKVTRTEQTAEQTQVGVALLQMMQSSQRSLRIISPYFVPGQKMTDQLTAMAKSAKDVNVLTNSLSANDVAAVHGGYVKYREQLVDSGVNVWELKPQDGVKVKSSLLGSSGASLHTKALTADGTKLFVGSYNLDPRSTWLNCEQGVVVDNEQLAQQLEKIFAIQTSGERAWRVTATEGDLQWSDGEEQFDADPKATFGKKFQAWLARVLNLDPHL